MAQETPKPIDNILVATGLTPESVGAVLQAKALAVKLGTHLHAAHVIEPVSESEEKAIPGLAEAHMKQADEELKVFAEAHGLTGDIEFDICKGSPEQEILRLRHRIDADLLVVGRYGKGGLKRGMLGSIADTLVRKCPVSVLVVQPEFRGDFKQIAVASDLSEQSEIAIRRALWLTKSLGHNQLLLLHSYEVPAGYHMVSTWETACERLEKLARERAEEVVSRLRAEMGTDAPNVKIVIHEGNPSGAVPKMALEEHVDLLMLSTHGRTTAALLLLGRTTEKILRQAHCSVWAEKSPALFEGFIDAIKEVLR